MTELIGAIDQTNSAVAEGPLMNYGRKLVIPESCSKEQLQKALDYAVDTRKLEIQLFWQRSLFFWGFIGAAFVAFANLTEKQNDVFAFLVACFGVICSLAWTLQNRGSKYWQEAWEQKVESLELRALELNLFSNKEPLNDSGWWGPSRYSVSRIAIALSFFTTGIWICLLAAAIPPSALPCWLGSADSFSISISLKTLAVWGALVMTFVFAVLLIARSGSKFARKRE